MDRCVKCGGALPAGALYCPACGKKQAAGTRTARKRANGEGSVYRYKGGWRAQIVLGYKLVGGKSRAIYKTKSGFKTKREALEYLETLKASGEKKRRIPTLLELWLEYQDGAYQKLSESRKEKYRIAWPKLQALHLCRIDLLTTSDLQAEIRTQKTFYPARDMRDLLSILYQIALANQFVSVNLAEHVDLPALEEKEQEAFKAEEITALWNDYAAGNWWTGYVLLLIYTGMMPGELQQLKKDAVDLEGHAIYKSGLKTEARKKKKPIILPDVILPVLEDLMAHTTGAKVIRINKHNFYDRYYETLERAGIRRLVPYSCRHTAATVLADAAVPPTLIQAIMRHASFATTQRYIHEDISREISAANTAAASLKNG